MKNDQKADLTDPYDPVSRIRDLLLATLPSPPEVGIDTLEAWLRDTRLPPLPGDDEPFLWLLRGLGEIDDDGEAHRTFAKWTGAILDREPESQAQEPPRDRLLYNLLMLAAGLGSPDLLAAPLRATYLRRKLKGSYLSIDLRGALRGALATNQADASLETIWRAMANGKPADTFLPGATFQGVEGLMFMPDPQKGPGHPALLSICDALCWQIEELEPTWDKKRELHAIFDRLLLLYPSHCKEISRALLEAAERSGWPDWAIESLPSLFLHVGRQQPCYWIWPHYANQYFDLQQKEPVTLFGIPFPEPATGKRRAFIKVSLSSRGEEFHERYFARQEEERLNLIALDQQLTGRQLLAALNDVMVEAELKIREDAPKEAENVQRARARILDHNDLPVLATVD